MPQSPSFFVFLLSLTAGLLSAAQADTGKLRVHDVHVSRGNSTTRMTLAIFDEKVCTLRLVDNASPEGRARFANLADAMTASGCLAGTNGGFFIRSPFDPFGLMISQGKAYGTFDPKSWMNGLIAIRSDRLSLEPAPSLQQREGIDSLLQTGPWLVQKGALREDLDPRRTAPRTFIATDSRGLWALGVSERCTLPELAALLRDPAITAVLDIQEAVNLDGGPSSGLWIKLPEKTLYLREGSTVRNYLGIVPRDEAASPPTDKPREK